MIAFYLLYYKCYTQNTRRNQYESNIKTKYAIKTFLNNNLHLGAVLLSSLSWKKFVDELHWIDEEEMLALTAITQASPGAIAVNAVILVGWKTIGFPGIIVAVIGIFIPPMVILTIISFFLCSFRIQYLYCTYPERNAGRGRSCNTGCCMKSGFQHYKVKKLDSLSHITGSLYCNLHF